MTLQYVQLKKQQNIAKPLINTAKFHHFVLFKPRTF